ncbi:MAG: hypothetical protein K2W99_05750 [Chthoniobacterales bacterium]|nr:hypothetical protein [Chthoniobacterales bacterium]
MSNLNISSGISEKALANNSFVKVLRQKKQPEQTLDVSNLKNGFQEGMMTCPPSPRSVIQVPFSRPESPNFSGNANNSLPFFASTNSPLKETASSSSQKASEKKSTDSDQAVTRPGSHTLDNADIPNVSKLYKFVPADKPPKSPEGRPLNPIEQWRQDQEQAQVNQIAEQMIKEAKAKYQASQNKAAKRGE